jgi:hypothetical protein
MEMDPQHSTIRNLLRKLEGRVHLRFDNGQRTKFRSQIRVCSFQAQGSVAVARTPVQPGPTSRGLFALGTTT